MAKYQIQIVARPNVTKGIQTYRGPLAPSGGWMRDRRPQILFGHHDDSFNYPRASFSSSSELRAVIIIWRLPSRHLACLSLSLFRPTLPTPSCRDSLRLPVQHRDSGVKANGYQRTLDGHDLPRPSMTIYFDCPRHFCQQGDLEYTIPWMRASRVLGRQHGLPVKMLT